MPDSKADELYRQDESSGIWYIQAGQGPPLLLLHGNGADAALHIPQLAYLAPHFRVLIPDLPGFGRSPARETWRMPLYMAELERFINKHIHEPFVLIGHSMGGYLAYQLLLRQRTQVVTQAILMEAAIFNISPQVAKVMPAYGIYHRLKAHSRERVEARLREWCLDYDQMPESFREGFIKSFFRSNRQVQGMMMSSAASLLPYRFDRLDLPILCIRGQKDQFLSRQTEFFFPHLPQARKAIIPDSGHFLIYENDAGLQREILDFLRPQASS